MRPPPPPPNYLNTAETKKVVRYITFHRTRKRELRKLLQLKKELHAAELIQRWTRGVLVRQRALLASSTHLGKARFNHTYCAVPHMAP